MPWKHVEEPEGTHQSVGALISSQLDAVFSRKSAWKWRFVNRCRGATPLLLLLPLLKSVWKGWSTTDLLWRVLCPEACCYFSRCKCFNLECFAIKGNLFPERPQYVLNFTNKTLRNKNQALNLEDCQPFSRSGCCSQCSNERIIKFQ